MREKILKLLREAGGELSGEVISDSLGVSRTAVWKQIKALKALGYEIETKSGSGYRLITPQRLLNQEELRLILENVQDVIPEAYYLASVDSTNTWAKGLEGRVGALLVASEQTAGRGRLGRQWISPKDKGIYVTLKLHPPVHPEKAMMLTQLMALGILRGLKDFEVADLVIKWPNDLVSRGRKLVGILTEMTTEIEQIEKFIIGFGINLHRDTYPDEIHDRVIALEEITERTIDPLLLIQRILEAFVPLYLRFIEVQDLSFAIDELNRNSAVVGRDILMIKNGEKVPCRGLKIDEGGRLWVKDPTGTTLSLTSGEVSIRGRDSYI